MITRLYNLALIGIFVIGSFSMSFAQDKRTEEAIIKVNRSNDFKALEEERLKLITDMYGMMYEISGLFTELERSVSLENADSDFEKLGVDSPSIEKQQAKIQSRLDEIRKQYIIPELKEIHGDSLINVAKMSVSEGFRRIIEGKVQQVLKKTDELSGVGARVTELNNTSYVSQNFKKQISWSFAVLVGIVIVGFFFIASRDKEIRKTIFSGDSGLQFITVFSLIIAIILFGITGILKGPELAGLIGGISGYILGRSSIKKKEKPNHEEVMSKQSTSID